MKLENILTVLLATFIFSIVVFAQSPLEDTGIVITPVQVISIPVYSVSSVPVVPVGVYENSFRFDFGVSPASDVTLIPSFSIPAVSIAGFSFSGFSFSGVVIHPVIYSLGITLFNFSLPLVQIISFFGAVALYRFFA